MRLVTRHTARPRARGGAGGELGAWEAWAAERGSFFLHAGPIGRGPCGATSSISFRANEITVRRFTIQHRLSNRSRTAAGGRLDQRESCGTQRRHDQSGPNRSQMLCDSRLGILDMQLIAKTFTFCIESIETKFYLLKAILINLFSKYPKYDELGLYFATLERKAVGYVV